jgi:hypothetical protein
MKNKKTLRICDKGHKFYKSSDCLTCPICEQQKKPKDSFLTLISAPARRALERENLTSLRSLSQISEKELLSLHGVGPSSIPKLKAALAAVDLSFKK